MYNDEEYGIGIPHTINCRKKNERIIVYANDFASKQTNWTDWMKWEEIEIIIQCGILFRPRASAIVIGVIRYDMYLSSCSISIYIDVMYSFRLLFCTLCCILYGAFSCIVTVCYACEDITIYFFQLAHSIAIKFECTTSTWSFLFTCFLDYLVIQYNISMYASEWTNERCT